MKCQQGISKNYCTVLLCSLELPLTSAVLSVISDKLGPRGAEAAVFTGGHLRGLPAGSEGSPGLQGCCDGHVEQWGNSGISGEIRASCTQASWHQGGSAGRSHLVADPWFQAEPVPNVLLP